ncbi:unnamed protein product [Cuscuta europaea]|uniref:Uncharacterized protein n=1 Tax=Cuscuta europaea TaxID=41803 RepID=A0A9P0ZUC9_CUSEU|nr:unnamed protein product [Cuscuta europaea]
MQHRQMSRPLLSRWNGLQKVVRQRQTNHVLCAHTVNRKATRWVRVSSSMDTRIGGKTDPGPRGKLHVERAVLAERGVRTHSLAAAVPSPEAGSSSSSSNSNDLAVLSQEQIQALLSLIDNNSRTCDRMSVADGCLRNDTLLPIVMDEDTVVSDMSGMASTTYTIPVITEPEGTPPFTEATSTQEAPPPLGRGMGAKRTSVLLRDFVTHHVIVSPSSLHSRFVSSSGQEPRSFREAMTDSGWRQAMQNEIEELEKNHTWSMQPLPPGKKALGCKWV